MNAKTMTLLAACLIHSSQTYASIEGFWRCTGTQNVTYTRVVDGRTWRVRIGSESWLNFHADGTWTQETAAPFLQYGYWEQTGRRVMLFQDTASAVEAIQLLGCGRPMYGSHGFERHKGKGNP
jgi:hypothetical protein